MNKSYNYLVPLLSNKCKIDGDYFIMLDNVYAIHSDSKNPRLILKYDYSDYKQFVNYISDLHDHELFLESNGTADSVELVFKFPKEFEYEYNKFLEGAYSKFRKSSKDIIIEYILRNHNLIKSNDIRDVLYKTDRLKRKIEEIYDIKMDNSMELESKPSVESETYTPE